MTNSATFPENLGGSGNTYTDDKDPTTGLDGGGHKTRWVPMLADVVAMAGTATTKAGEAAGSATTASEKATQTGEDRTEVADDRTAVQQLRNEATTARDQAQASQTAAAGSASTATTKAIEAAASETAAAGSAASAAMDAQRAESTADGLIGRRTVTTVSGTVTVGDDQSGYHYRAQGADLNELRLSKSATVGVTVHLESNTADLVHVAVDNGGTLRSRGGRKYITERYGVVTATKVTSTEWTVAGDLGAVATSNDDYEHDDNELYAHDTGEIYQNAIISAA